MSGVLGTFSSATWDEFGQPTACVFTADAGQLGANKVVDVGAPTESVWASGKEFDVLEIGIGRNNYPGGTDVNVINRALSIVKRDILAVIAWQRTAQKRFIIMTPPNGGGEGSTSNSVGFQFFLKLERWAAAQFGELVINSRQELMRRGDGGATDNAAIADGRVPPSLTTDGLHWTDTAQGYLRAAGAAVFNRRGW